MSRMNYCSNAMISFGLACQQPEGSAGGAPVNILWCSNFQVENQSPKYGIHLGFNVSFPAESRVS
jgi:hypothetical protein